jgi:hypothetical protein
MDRMSASEMVKWPGSDCERWFNIEKNEDFVGGSVGTPSAIGVSH